MSVKLPPANLCRFPPLFLGAAARSPPGRARCWPPPAPCPHVAAPCFGDALLSSVSRGRMTHDMGFAVTFLHRRRLLQPAAPPPGCCVRLQQGG